MRRREGARSSAIPMAQCPNRRHSEGWPDSGLSEVEPVEGSAILAWPYNADDEIWPTNIESSLTP